MSEDQDEIAGSQEQKVDCTGREVRLPVLYQGLPGGSLACRGCVHVGRGRKLLHRLSYRDRGVLHGKLPSQGGGGDKGAGGKSDTYPLRRLLQRAGGKAGREALRNRSRKGAQKDFFLQFRNRSGGDRFQAGTLQSKETPHYRLYQRISRKNHGLPVVDLQQRDPEKILCPAGPGGDTRPLRLLLSLSF